MTKSPAREQFDRLDRAWETPGCFTATIVGAALLIFLVAAWPTVVFHGTARWIGEGLWVGIPALIAGSLFAAARWSQRDARKLKRLRDERLRAEGRHPQQLQAQEAQRAWQKSQQEAEERRKAAEERRAAEREAAQAHKQQVRDAIREEERLREERNRTPRGT